MNDTDNLRSVVTLRLDREIGKGAYGSVWKVLAQFKDSNENEDTSDLCMKMIKTTEAHGIEAPVEIDVLCRLSHPNLMKCISLKGLNTSTSKPESTLGIIMPLCHTQIYTFSRTYHPHIRTKLKIFLDVALGLQFLHQNGILHLDIKPDNVLIKKDMSDPIQTGILVDFGLAVYHNGNGMKILSNNVVTKNYRPPELSDTCPFMYSTATDVWALACVFLYTLAERKTCLKPYDPKDLNDILVPKHKRFSFFSSIVASANSGFSESSISPKSSLKEGSFDVKQQKELAFLLTSMFDTNPNTRATINDVVKCLETTLQVTIPPLGKTRLCSYYPSEDITIVWYLIFDMMVRLMIKLEVSVEVFFLAIDLFHRVTPLFPDASEYSDLSLLAAASCWIATKTIGDLYIKSLVIIDWLTLFKANIPIEFSDTKSAKRSVVDATGLVRIERTIIELIEGVIYQPNLYIYNRHSNIDLINCFECLRNPNLYVKALYTCANGMAKRPKQQVKEMPMPNFANYYSKTNYYNYMKSQGLNFLNALTKLHSIDKEIKT